jgi:hypothetical protein
MTPLEYNLSLVNRKLSALPPGAAQDRARLEHHKAELQAAIALQTPASPSPAVAAPPVPKS